MLDALNPDEMTPRAALEALASAGVDGASVDLVVVGTCTPDGMFPAVASRIQHAVGAAGAAAGTTSSRRVRARSPATTATVGTSDPVLRAAVTIPASAASPSAKSAGVCHAR